MDRMDEVSTRVAFGETLEEMAGENPELVVVSADTARSMGLKGMEKKYPDRVINVGIAEQHMMTAAAGLAASGFNAVATTYAPFTCMRALEEVRTFIAYPNLNVTVVGGMSGITGSIEGVTHQGQEDINLMTAIPNFVVAVACDACAAREMTRVLVNHPGPAYLALGRSQAHKVFDTYHYEIGKGYLLRDGEDLTIISYGSMVWRCREACELLAAEGIHARLIEMPTIKPLDREIVQKAARETGAILTVEDRNVMGGLGSQICQAVCAAVPVPVRCMGLNDCFAESGLEDELYEYCHLGIQDVVAGAKALWQSKKGAENHE